MNTGSGRPHQLPLPWAGSCGTSTFSGQLNRLTSALHPRGTGRWGRGLELSRARWEEETEVSVGRVWPRWMSLGKNKSSLLLWQVGMSLDRKGHSGLHSLPITDARGQD